MVEIPDIMSNVRPEKYVGPAICQFPTQLILERRSKITEIAILAKSLDACLILDYFRIQQ